MYSHAQLPDSVILLFLDDFSIHCYMEDLLTQNTCGLLYRSTKVAGFYKSFTKNKLTHVPFKYVYLLEVNVLSGG